MVKKLKYLLFFIPFLFTLNVNAMLLGTPNSFAHFNDDSIVGPSNATSVGWWGTNNYYRSPYLMGGTSNQQWVNRIDFNWNNANLCPNDDISISGSVGALSNMFTEQSTSLVGFNNGVQLSCVTSIQESGSRLDYSCYGKGGGTLSFYVFMNSFSLVKQYEIGITKNMTVSCDASNLDVIQNATANTNSIINNNNQNTNTIVDNNNQNTDKIIDSQKDLLGNCNKNLISLNSVSLSGRNYNYSISLEVGKTYNISTNSGIAVCVHNGNFNCVNELLFNNYGGGSYSSNHNITATSNSLYLSASSGTGWGNYNITFSETMLSLGSGPTSFVPYGTEKCTSKLDQQTDAINGLNDSITSEQNPNTNQDINDMNDMVASDTPITDLLTLPMTLINAYYNGINASCSPYNFGSLLGTDIIFPCINLENRLGHNLWMIIDSLCSIFIIYSIAMLFVHAFDSLTSLKDDFDDMYVPRHAGKHVGGGFNG